MIALFSLNNLFESELKSKTWDLDRSIQKHSKLPEIARKANQSCAGKRSPKKLMEKVAFFNEIW